MRTGLTPPPPTQPLLLTPHTLSSTPNQQKCTPCSLNQNNRVLLALARGQVLTVLPLLPSPPAAASADAGDSSSSPQQQHQHPQQQQQQQYPIHSSKHEYTALGWYGQLQSSSRSRPGSAQQQQHHQQHSQHQIQQQMQQPRCTADAYQSLLESEVLLSGTADGHLQIHSASGQVLYKQRLHGSAVMDILVRPHCSGAFMFHVHAVHWGEEAAGLV